MYDSYTDLAGVSNLYATNAHFIVFQYKIEVFISPQYKRLYSQMVLEFTHFSELILELTFTIRILTVAPVEWKISKQKSKCNIAKSKSTSRKF